LTASLLAGVGFRRAARRAVPAACVAYALLLLAPWRFVLPAPGLDPSWIQVVAHAAQAGWQWGRDIVFTYGPLGYLAFASFSDVQVASKKWQSSSRNSSLVSMAWSLRDRSCSARVFCHRQV